MAVRCASNTCCPTKSKATVNHLVSQTSAPPVYVSWPGNLAFVPVEVSPASTELPLVSYPTITCGEILALADTTTKGRTPAAPVPRKFRWSPVGTRTSTPSATATRSPFQAVPFTRRVMSPIPDTLRKLENELLRQGTKVGKIEPQPARMGNT